VTEHPAAESKRTGVGPFTLFATVGLLVAALAARVSGRTTLLIVRRMVLVRVAGIAALGSVAHALVAVLVLLIVAGAGRQRLTADDAGIGHRHGDARQDSTRQGPAGNGDRPVDGVPREDVSLERRSRQGRSGVRCPEHVARLPATGHDHGEIGARERAIDEEDPDPVRGSSERQRAGLGHRIRAVDTGRKIQAPEDAWRRDAGRGLELERGVGTEEINARLNGGRVGRRGHRAGNRAAGIREWNRATGRNAHISNDHAAGAGYIRATQDRESRSRAQRHLGHLS